MCDITYSCVRHVYVCVYVKEKKCVTLRIRVFVCARKKKCVTLRIRVCDMSHVYDLPFTLCKTEDMTNSYVGRDKFILVT